MMIKVLLILFLIILLMKNNRIENFSAGTGIQLLTSKPYYTWYDYYTQLMKYPYYRPYYNRPYRPYYYGPYYRPYYF
jgi:hypothetical protein